MSKDTRGRPRLSWCDDMVETMRKLHTTVDLPELLVMRGRTVAERSTNLKRLRNSTAYKELQKEFGYIFRLLDRGSYVEVCYRKGVE